MRFRRTGGRTRRRARRIGPWSWPVALGASATSAAAGLVLLSPRSGLMAPDPVRCEELFDAEQVARARAYRRLTGDQSSGSESG